MRHKVSILNEFMNAPSVIKECKLRGGYFISGIIGAILFITFYFLSNKIGERLFIEIKEYLSLDNSFNMFRYIFIFFTRIFLFAIYYFLFRTILLILLSPFFSYFSEKVERQLEGREYSFSIKENINSIKRGVIITLKNFFKEIFFTFCILILGLIPLLSIFVPFFIFLIQSYFIGYSFVDYTLERKGFNQKDSILFMKKNFFSICFGGVIFTFLYFIPLIGIFIAPIITIVSFTTLTLKLLKNN